MKNRPGLWLAIDGSLEDSIRRSIESNECFTTTVPSEEIRPRHNELVAVSLDGASVDYLGISVRGRRIVTGQKSILVRNCVAIPRARQEAIRLALPLKFRDKFRPPKVGVYRPTPRLWEEIVNCIMRLNADAAEEIRHIRGLANEPGPSRGIRSGGIEVFERDALASIWEAWGGPSLRKRELRKLTPVAPFLSSLKSAYVREDPMITQDQINFPDFHLVRSDVVGSIVMSDMYGREHLTVLNCNRQALEHTLGVDLVYYNHSYNSFVMVQYKRMIQGPRGEAHYRPDSDANHEGELGRMIEADRTLLLQGNQQPEAMLDTYRLSSGAFYLKLCAARVNAALDAGMVPGMYFPLGLWRVMCQASEMRGPKGGLVMTWDNCRRRLNNSEFSRLLRQGWIGSAAGQSSHLQSLIEKSLQGRRMVVIGATSAGPMWDDARRDNLGRFAAQDDPEGG